MAGGGGEQKVGDKYYAGIHFLLGQPVIDKLKTIKVDDRLAWADGSGSGTGIEAEDPSDLGTVSGMSATAMGGDEGETAKITFTGVLGGVSIDGTYDLLLEDASTETVTVVSATYDGDNDETHWYVTPNTTSFASQSVTVYDPSLEVESGTAPSVSGTAGRIMIDKPELFGGDTREGGIVGEVDILDGDPDQVENDYLQSILGDDIPAWRRVATLVFRHVYLQMQPYLKPIRFEVQRIYKTSDGSDQWYSAKAGIVTGTGDSATTLTFDIAPWRYKVEARGTGSDYSAPGYDDSDWNSGVLPVGDKYNPNAADEGFRATPGTIVPLDREVWLRRTFLLSGPLTNLECSVFVDNDVVVLVNGTEVYSRTGTHHFSDDFTILDDDLQVGENVIAVKVIDDGPTSVDYFTFDLKVPETIADTPGLDMNPAHIIRECLTDTEWGLGIPTADIGSSFTTVADTLFSEGFGLSLLWRDDNEVWDFIQTILNTIDAALYIDRATGLWELKLIRDDYEVSGLTVLNDYNIIKFGDIKRRDPAVGPNVVVVKYTSRAKERESSLTLSNNALVASTGVRRYEEVEYLGIQTSALASRVASRDLRALTSAIADGTLTVNRVADTLNPGDPFVLDVPRYGFNSEVCRVISIEESVDESIELKFASDVFALGDDPFAGVNDQGGGWRNGPIPVTQQVIQEAPYWEAVLSAGQTNIDASLSENPDAGLVMVAAARPTGDSLGLDLYASTGGAYSQTGTGDYFPFATLAGTLSDDPTAETVAITGGSDLAQVAIGTIAYIGTEAVRVDFISSSSITVGRGVHDTVPIAHEAGEAVIFTGLRPSGLAEEYDAGETVYVKPLTITSLGTLDIDDAEASAVTLNSRAIRPLPPGNVKANGEYSISANALTGSPNEVVFTWAHRDRTAQTTESISSYTAGDIGPEAGVEYVVDIRWVDGDGNTIDSPVAAEIVLSGTPTTFTLTPSDIPLSPAPPSGSLFVDVQIGARREVNGVYYREWTNRTFRLLAPPVNGGWGYNWGINWGGS